MQRKGEKRVLSIHLLTCPSLDMMRLFDYNFANWNRWTGTQKIPRIDEAHSLKQIYDMLLVLKSDRNKTMH